MPQPQNSPLQPQPTLTHQAPPPVRKPQKITQLLCLDQNIQLKQIFTQWLTQSFKYLPKILQSTYLQLQLLINFIEYRFTVSRDMPQVGDYLQNIKYKQCLCLNEIRNLNKRVKILFLVLDVILPYLKRRLVMIMERYIEKYQSQEQQQQAVNEEIQDKVSFKQKIVNFLKKLLSLIALLDKLYALATFINLATFIKNGTYRSITQRLLKMQMQFVNPQNSRVLNFTLMNRTMIWQIYQMVLKNILPYLYKFLGTGLKNIFYLHSYMGVEEKQENENCSLCGQVPTMVVQAEECGHVYCFYCSKSVGEEKKECKKCGQEIGKWKAVYG